MTNIAFNADGTITVTYSDGTSKVFPTTAPVVAPTDTEVDILLSDGTTKKFVPVAYGGRGKGGGRSPAFAVWSSLAIHQ